MTDRSFRFVVWGSVGLLVFAASLIGAAQTQPPADRFFQAIRANDLQALRSLATQGNLDAKDSAGLTPLVEAAAFGTSDAVELLLNAGASVNAQSDGGLTALHVAWHDESIVRLLLFRGADVNAKTALGATPVLVASSAVGSAAVVTLLVERGADIDEPENRGVTPLIAAAAVGNGEVARLLMAREADTTAYASGTGQKTATPLMAAVSGGDIELTRELLGRRVDVNAKSPDNDGIVKNGPVAFGTLTALHFAVASHNLEISKLLVDAGAAIDARDARGATPLMWAIGSDRADPALIRFLLDRGASATVTSVTGESAADWARKYNDPAVLSLLKAAPAAVAPPAPKPAVSIVPREAVERSLKLLRIGSGRVMTEGGCTACHAQPMTAIAAQYASTKGWSVESAANDITQVARTMRDGVAGNLQGRESGGLPETQEYNAFMAAELHLPPSVNTDALVSYLTAKQQPAGNWRGISTRPPIQDGDLSRTALAIRVLTAFGPPAHQAALTDRITRAADWLAAEPPRSTEERAMQIFGLSWANAHKDVRDQRVRDLTALQAADGGWGQTPHLSSDAYATGEVVTALRTAGIPGNDPTIQRAVEFLLKTQAPDGSWYVKSRAMKIQPYFESGFPYGPDQWISQSGTAWAAIGIAAAAPDAPAPAQAR